MAPIHRLYLIPATRSFHTTTRHHGLNPLFHLQGLSTSRETQWLSKASGLSRIEHSPGLQLLRSEAELQKAAKAASPSVKTTPSLPPRGSPASAKSDVSTTARPWIRKLRKELDEFDRALTNHRIINSRHGAGHTTYDDDMTSDIEKTYEARLQERDAEIVLLRSQLLKEQVRYEADHKSWAAVKMTMNSYKERAEAAGALSIVIATVLAAVLYYEKYHSAEPKSSNVELAPSSAHTETPAKPIAERLAETLALRDLPVPTPPAAPSSDIASQGPTPERQRSRRALFWDD